MVAGDLRGHLPGWPPGDGGCEHVLCPALVEQAQGPSLGHLCLAPAHDVHPPGRSPWRSGIARGKPMTGLGSTTLKGRGAECVELDRACRWFRRLGEPVRWSSTARQGLASRLCWSTSPSRPPRVVTRPGSRYSVRDGTPFAALHQLCGPMLDHLDRLHGPQREALKTVFGSPPGSAPDPLVVGWPPWSVVGGGGDSRLGVPDRRPPMAGPGITPGPRLRRPSAGGGVARPRLCHSSTWPGAHRGSRSCW